MRLRIQTHKRFWFDPVNNCHAIFRGTETFNLKDTLTDAIFWTTDWQGGGKVHRGFQRAIDDLFQTTSIAADLRQCDNLTMAGHSLGAALATLAADITPSAKHLQLWCAKDRR